MNDEISETNRGIVALYDELDTVQRVSRVVASKLELTALLEAIADATVEISGAECGGFFRSGTNGACRTFSIYTVRLRVSRTPRRNLQLLPEWRLKCPQDRIWCQARYAFRRFGGSFACLSRTALLNRHDGLRRSWRNDRTDNPGTVE